MCLRANLLQLFMHNDSESKGNEQVKTCTIYGAVTPPRDVDTHRNLKYKLKEAVDRVLVRSGKTSRLNYRNYVQPTCFNRGDLAIALGVDQIVKSINKDIVTKFLDWDKVELINNSDALLIGGSGYFLLNREGFLPERIYRDAEYLIANRIPYGFYGVGVNQVSEALVQPHVTSIDKKDAALVSRLLSKSTFISVRDSQSLNALQQHTDSPIYLSGDPALFLRPTTEAGKANTLPHQLRIGINIPFHGPSTSDRVRDDLQKYIKFLHELQATTSAEFVQLIHFDTECIIGRLLQDAGLNLTIINGTVEQLQSAYASLDLHIGGMLHSCILACSVGTPCVGLAYDVKHFGFFSLMGLDKYCVPSMPFDSASTLEICESALRDGDSLRHQIDGRRQQLGMQAEDYLRINLPKLLN